MNETNFFIKPLGGMEYFSVINTIIVLREILFNNTKWTFESQVEPIPIINALCEFLDRNSQDEEKLLALGRKLLKETDFYGTKENESLSLNFVNAILDQIIVNTVFSKFGNTFGYLSTIVNEASDLKYRSFKESIKKNLQEQTFLNDKGTLSVLTNVTIRRITESVIFPLFPNSKKNIEIIHFRYLYAQAGWLLSRGTQKNLQNNTFSELIALALDVEQEVLQGKIDPSALKIFQLPALLYYTHQKENGIKQKNLNSFMVSTNFWHRVYNQLFRDVNITVEKISFLQKQNPSYRFQMALADFKTRTALAEQILRNNCQNETDLESALIDYKNNPEEYYCNRQLQPDVNEMFFSQNRIIAEKYYYYEKHLISQVFDEDLKKFIDLKNVTIKPIAVFWKNNCFRCRILTGRPTLSEGIDLFQIFEAGVAKTMYALIRSTNGMKLLPARDVYSFLEEIGLNNRAKLDVPFAAEDMKSSSSTDDFDTFATFVAKSREKKFLAYLKNIGYDATTLEKVSDFFKHLIPFYSCAESIQDADTTKQTAAMACIVDSIVLTPVFGLLTSTSVKFTTVTMRSALLRLNEHMGELTLKEIFKSVMKIGFRVLAEDIIMTASQIITKQFIQNFGVAILRSLDPGIEFFYMLTKTGVRTLINGWRLLKNKFPVKSFDYLKSVTNIKIGTYKGYDVHVQSINGESGFGLKTIDYKGTNVEFRRILGYANEMPVVVVNNAWNHKKYRIIDLETGELSKTEWEEKDQILINAVKPLRVHLKMIQVEGLSGKGAISLRRKRKRLLDNRISSINNAAYKIHHPANRQMVINFLKQHVLDTFGQDYRSVVNHWLLHNSFPKWCELYKLSNPVLYTKLRFDPSIGHRLLNPYEIINEFTKFYVRNVNNIDVLQLYNFYISQKVYNSITFQDQFALANFMNSYGSRLHLDDLESLNMKSALYRIVLRQFDDNNLFLEMSNKIFYSIEVKDYNDIILSYEPKVFDVKEYKILSRGMNDVLQFFENVRDNTVIKILHKVKLQHPCLAVYLEKYLPFNTNHVVLLPGIQLSLNSWRYNTINGMNILVLDWISIGFDESKWLVDTTNKIEILNDREQLLLGNK